MVSRTGFARHIVLVAALATTTSAAVLPATNNSSERRLADDAVLELCGVDLVGGDTSTHKNTDPDGCPMICFALDAKSDSTTWTNFDGGTCWCKKLHGFDLSDLKKPFYQFESTPNAAAVSYIKDIAFEGTEGSVVETKNGFDIPGYDIDNKPSGQSSGCASLCRANGKCFAYTWTNYAGGTCWLKARANTFMPRSGAVSAYITRAANFKTCPKL